MTKPRPRPATPSDYPAGFFLELVRQHCWPPRFEARLYTIDMGDKPNRRAEHIHGGWGAGTLYMPNTPKDQVKPAWMPRPATRAAR